jgi:predicted dinucleotide-binding enzyme
MPGWPNFALVTGTSSAGPAVVGGMRIGFIGSGRIGSTVAGLAVAAGHDVVLSNTRGPESLADLVGRLGPRAEAATVPDAAAAGEIVLVAIPLHAYGSVPVEPLAGKIVMDANNYYSQRDGHIAALDAGETTSSELLAAHLPASRVVKVFNTIESSQLASQGQPSGTPDRRAIPIAGDDAQAKKVVAELLDSFGYDVVEAGPLAEGRRFEPGTAPYGPRLTVAELRDALVS